MTATPERPFNRWRIARWTAAAALLCIPAIAMRVPGTGMDWRANDFIVMAALLAATLGAYELLASHAPDIIYRAAAGLTALGLFLLVWLNLAVGIIGSEGNPANLMFAGVIAVIVGGAGLTRFAPRPLGNALFTAAAAQLLIGVIALAGDLGGEGRAWPRDVIVLTAFFTGLWGVAGTLFRLSRTHDG